MSENERGFIPENPDQEHDMTEAYMDAQTDAEFFEALAEFKDTDKLILSIEHDRMNVDLIRKVIDRFPKTEVAIFCKDEEDKKMVEQMLPYPNSVKVLIA